MSSSSSRFESNGVWVWCFEGMEWERLGSASIEVGSRASCSLSGEVRGRRGCFDVGVIVTVDQCVVLSVGEYTKYVH